MGNDIEKILLALESEFGVMITVHDLSGIFHDLAGNPLLGSRRQSHKRSILCYPRERDDCFSFCMGKVNARAAQCHEDFFISKCWAGLVEIVAPMRRENLHVATIFAGTWRWQEGRMDIPACYKKSPRLNAAYLELPLLESGRSTQLGLLLANAGRGLLSKLESLQKIDSESATRKEEIWRYILTNASRKLSTRDLAKKLHVSPSRAGHITGALFGMTFADLLIHERLTRAKTLLRSTDSPISQIAIMSGFGNEFHFSRMFRKLVGQAPGRFRKDLRKKGQEE